MGDKDPLKFKTQDETDDKYIEEVKKKVKNED